MSIKGVGEDLGLGVMMGGECKRGVGGRLNRPKGTRPEGPAGHEALTFAG